MGQMVFVVDYTQTRRPRGRPRGFDADQAVATAQRLFHARGYEAVSIADLTDALGINPPSFYAAFGSKAGLYGRVLDRYAGDGIARMVDLLDPDRPVPDCLAAVLEAAARLYAADPAAAGCLVIEGARSPDRNARAVAGQFLAAAEDAIRQFITARCPSGAERLTDYMGIVMAGLSAKARNGHDLDRLLASARLAASGLAQAAQD